MGLLHAKDYMLNKSLLSVLDKLHLVKEIYYYDEHIIAFDAYKYELPKQGSTPFIEGFANGMDYSFIYKE